MAMPRSEAGFIKAIEDKKAEIAELDKKLSDAEADSQEESDLIEQKGEATIDLQMLEEGFAKFNAKKETNDDEPGSDAKGDDESGDLTTQTPSDEDNETMSKPDTKETPEKVWPELIRVTCRAGVGFMVNPYNHIRINEGDDKKVECDKWTISQIEAGILIVVD